MINYYIIGSSGFAKEVLFLSESVLDSSYTFGGFIDYQPTNNSVYCNGNNYKVFKEADFLDKIKPSSDVILFIGIGDPKKLEKISEKFRGYSFPNLIHPSSVYHSKSVEIGVGNIITCGCVFTVDIKIGSYNIFNLNATIGHDTIIGSFNVINPGSNISGSVFIGNGNLIGTNATVLQGIQIGSGNVLGAASLANKNIENNQVMVGVPAKPIKRD